MNTKISEAAIDAGARVLADARGHGMREKAVVLAEQVIAAVLPHLHPQPAELAQQQGVWSNVAEEMAYSEMHAVVQRAGGYRNGLLGEMLRAGMHALAAAGKQQVGESCNHEWRTAGGGSQARRPLVCSKCNQHRDHMPQQVGEVQGDGRAQFEAWNNSLPSLYRYNLNRWSNEAQEYRSRHTRAAFTAWQAALAARQPEDPEPRDAIERIARLLYLRSCNRHQDGTPFTDWDALAENLKDYSRDEARKYEALRNTALWPAGRENYTSSGVIR